MADGSFYVAAANGILYSPDGNTWNLIPNSRNILMSLATDGANVWTSKAYPYNPSQRPAPSSPLYWAASASNPNAWTSMTGVPTLASDGCWTAYDPVHHILYSANYWDGLWRLVLQ